MRRWLPSPVPSASSTIRIPFMGILSGSTTTVPNMTRQSPCWRWPGRTAWWTAEYYDLALDEGWHVAPTNNQNNHNGQWGDASDARTVVLAKSLTEEALYAAMKDRRVYATQDSDLTIYL